MLLDDALALQVFGYKVVPVTGKTPVGKAWHQRVWDETALRAAFENGANGIGLILDGLLDLDADGPEGAPTIEALGLPATVGWGANKGPHRLYRLTPEQQAQFNGKSRWKIGDLEIRTGAKLQSVIPPSPGRTWHGRSLIEELPSPIPDLSWLPSSDALPSNGPNSTESAAHRDDRPGDIYNAKAEWAEILEPLGFTRVRERAEGDKRITDWRRAGTDKPLSATTGYCQSTGGEDRLYVFSTNCEPFEAEKSYSKFEAYCIVNHGGDHTAGAADLAGLGYNASIPVDVFAPVQIVKPSLAVPRFPGLIEEIAAWHCRRSRVADRTAGTVAGIMAVSWMLGRTARLATDGTRANLFALLSGRPGSGKTETQHSLVELLTAAGKQGEVVLATASGEALDDRLSLTPRMLFVRDECQDLISELGDSAFKRSIPKMLKEIYSKARSIHAPRAKANAKEETPAIIQPYLTTLFLASTSTIWDRMPEALYRDGFIARLIVCDVDPKAPTNRNPIEGGVPDSFLESVRHWQDPAQCFEGTDDAEGEHPPRLRSIPCTGDAAEALADLGEEWRFRPGSDTEAEFFTRGQEMVCKLCMIGAASLGVDGEVDRDMVDRMRAFVEASIHRKITAWESRFTGSEYLRTLTDRITGMLARGPVYYSKLKFNLLRGYSIEEIESAVYGLLLGGQIAADVDLTTDKRCVQKIKKIWLPTCAPLKLMVG